MHPGIGKTGPCQRGASRRWSAPVGPDAPWSPATCSTLWASVSGTAQRTRKQIGSRALPTSGRGWPARQTSPSGSSASTPRSAAPRPCDWSSPHGGRRRPLIRAAASSEDECCWDRPEQQSRSSSATAPPRCPERGEGGSSETRLASLSSASSTSGTPRTFFDPLSTPMTIVPPAVFANATSVLRIPSGEDKSRLNSRVLPSGRLSRSTSGTTPHITRKWILPQGFRPC